MKDARFNPIEALAMAADVLSRPPSGVLPRVDGRGQLVHAFVFPLALCQNENSHSHGSGWRHAKRKDELWDVMRKQCSTVRPSPLPGRPMVRQVRFSSVEPDVAGEGFKTAIDFLRVPVLPKKPGGRFKRGLGFLVDDAPKFVERVAWWERVAPKQGFALLEIYTG